MFLRNSSNSLNVQNYPKFKDIIDQSQWTYLSQHWLSSDPIDYNSNTEVYNLIGGASEQDTEIDEIYKNAIRKHGEGNVLGILATKSDNHDIYKREAEETSPPLPTISPTEEPMNENFLYYEQGKAILYTTSAPKLIENGTSANLATHGLVKTDERDGLFRIIVTFFKVNRGEPKVTLRFRFKIANGYWSITSVEVEDSKNFNELHLSGKPITVPLQFSYKCAQTLVFKSSNSTTPISLILTNVQVQPLMNGSSQFGDAFDCVGFTTAPIWSGIFVTSFISAIIMLGLLCILEIKPPNKFENNRGKQLTFTVQE